MGSRDWLLTVFDLSHLAFARNRIIQNNRGEVLDYVIVVANRAFHIMIDTKQTGGAVLFAKISTVTVLLEYIYDSHQLGSSAFLIDKTQKSRRC